MDGSRKCLYYICIMIIDLNVVCFSWFFWSIIQYMLTYILINILSRCCMHIYLRKGCNTLLTSYTRVQLPTWVELCCVSRILKCSYVVDCMIYMRICVLPSAISILCWRWVLMALRYSCTRVEIHGLFPLLTTINMSLILLLFCKSYLMFNSDLYPQWIQFLIFLFFWSLKWFGPWWVNNLSMTPS